MTSIKERVSFAGTLRGQGQEATCTGFVTKVSLPGTSEFAYANYSIQQVSKQLPEGNYEILVNGETIRLRFHNGFWLSA